MNMANVKILVLVLLFSEMCNGKIHLLTLTNDERSLIALSSFDYLKGGFLEVNITNLKISTNHPQALIGFTFDKSSSIGTSSYVERKESDHGCVLNDVGGGTFDDVPRAILKIVRKKEGDYELQIKEQLLNGLQFYASAKEYNAAHGIVPTTEALDFATNTVTSPRTKTRKAARPGYENLKPDEDNISPSLNEGPSPQDGDTDANSPPGQTKKKRAAVPAGNDKGLTSSESAYYKSLQPLPISGGPSTGMNLTFYVKMDSDEQIGLYELYFHNCLNSNPIRRNSDSQLVNVSLIEHIVEKNIDSYLSAGDMDLPLIYNIVSLLFFIAGIIWMRLICSKDEKVFKIHYFMAVVVLMKGISVMFHSIVYFFICKDGHTEFWAVIFYFAHMLKGILFYICLLLISTGWTFIKTSLSSRDKKLFAIVIPMQVMVNIACIIMEGTEEGNKSYDTWKNIVILVDLLCCLAVYIPVIWTLRHLKRASLTDKNPLIILAKHRVYRHFYIMYTCYAYLTRIIVYLLEIALPFQYMWIHVLVSELCAFVFYSLTGYKFRPGRNNPCFQLDPHDDGEDHKEMLTQSGATENITRVNKHEKDITETGEFDALLPKQETTKI